MRWSARSATTSSPTRRSRGFAEAGVELDVERKGQTGVALIYVDSEGENEIAVFPGANAEVTPRAVEGAVLCQLEISRRGRAAAAAKATSSR